MPLDTTRRIYFFSSTFRRPVPGTNRLAPADPTPAFTHIETLPWLQNAVPSRYMRVPGGDDVFLIIDKIGKSIHGRMLIGRRSNFPDVEVAGAFTHLVDMGLPPRAALAESAHFILFPSGHLGMEFNFYAPRATRLAGYLMDKAKDICPYVEFRPILRGDVEERLRTEIGGIVETVLIMHRDMLGPTVDLHPDLGSAFGSLKDAASSLEIGIVLRRQGRSGLVDIPWRDDVGPWLMRDDVRNGIKTFDMRAYSRHTGRVETFDLLQDKLVHSAPVIKVDDTSRTIRSDSMYSAIEEAYTQLKPHLTS